MRNKAEVKRRADEIVAAETAAALARAEATAVEAATAEAPAAPKG